MEQRIKNIRIDYTLTYAKTRRRANIVETDVDKGSENEDSPASKRHKSNVFSHFVLLILAIDNHHVGRGS